MNRTALLNQLNKRRDEEGFTLIELMIVVVIIGILAAIAIPIFANQQKEAIISSVKSDVANTRSSIPDPVTMVKSPEEMETRAVVTDGNTARYFVNNATMSACYDVSYAFSATDTVSYRFLTSVGKVELGNCDTFASDSNAHGGVIGGGNDSDGEQGGDNSGGSGTPTPTPTPTPDPTNSDGNSPSGSGTPAPLSARYILTKSPDWTTGYKVSFELTANSVGKPIPWKITWTDPNATAIQDAWGMNCTLASGGVITCIGTGWTVNNFQWSQTISAEGVGVNIITSNLSATPTNPTLSVTLSE